MPLAKQGYSIPFGQGLDLQTDPNQVVAGKMLGLQNVVFTKANLQKRNGFGAFTELPVSTTTTLTTLNNTLLATGADLYAYNASTNEWYNKGTVQPVDLDVIPLVRNAGAQTAPDVAVSSAGLSCTVYEDRGRIYYQINDINGQIIVNQTTLPVTAACPRVFVLGRYFIVTFLRTITATPHLQYLAIPISNPTNPGNITDISSQVSSTSAGYDAVVENNTLVIAWDGSDVGGAIRISSLNSALIQNATISYAGYSAQLMSVTADSSTTTPTIWVTFWETTNNDGYTLAINTMLNQVLAPTLIIDNIELIALTSVATANLLSVFYEVSNTYSYSSVRSDYISTLTCTSAGVVSATSTLIRSVGLGSKAFFYGDSIYMLTAFSSPFQPTYFLIDSLGNIILKLAYSNGGGYATNQVLSSVTLQDETAYFAYLFKDQLVSVSKEVDPDAPGGIYAQTGVNLAKIQINLTGQYNSEMANTLQLTGGILWQYDSVKPVEHGFHVWPESAAVTTATTGGNVNDGSYNYAFCYEWTDGAGNLHRSAPSVPITITTTGGNTSTNTLKVPTLRLTYKTAPNQVRIVGYRYSVAQPVFYQFTSISSPSLNNSAVDSITITDTHSDLSILGNTILYTTGGVVENIAAPASSASVVTPLRQWIINAENKNELWFSKIVGANTPVQFSDLLTYYVSPSTVTQGSSAGPCEALAYMDDKLIIFKTLTPYYVTGRGPDDTGANNDFSEPTNINSPVGCDNPNSIVTTPVGILFQASKVGGIWILRRNLGVEYIGSPVESYNNQRIVSAITVPGTNEVRFTLDGGTVLMYDYYYDQWSTFIGIPGVSSTVYNGLHTYLNSRQQVRIETPGLYLDGSNPVLISFSTAWFKLTNLQGFQRAYFFYFLGEFLSPHKLAINIAYDYNPNATQSTLITPINATNQFGEGPYYGSGSPYGGSSSVEQWRVFLNQQKCQSIRITVNEIYNPSQGIAPGAGFTMSGITMVFGGKATYPKLPANQSSG